MPVRGAFFVELRILPGEDSACGVLAVYRGDVDSRRMIAPEDAKLDLERVAEDARFATSLSPEAVQAFYRTELAAFGWKAVEAKDALAPTIHCVLIGVAPENVFEQRLVRVMIDVGTPTGGQTAVRLRSWGAPSRK